MTPKHSEKCNWIPCPVNFGLEDGAFNDPSTERWIIEEMEKAGFKFDLLSGNFVGEHGAMVPFSTETKQI